MLTPEKRAQAIEAIKAAQPHWTDRDIRYALERMPSFSGYAYSPTYGPEWRAAKAKHDELLAAWLERVLHTPNAEPFQRKFG